MRQLCSKPPPAGLALCGLTVTIGDTAARQGRRQPCAAERERGGGGCAAHRRRMQQPRGRAWCIEGALWGSLVRQCTAISAGANDIARSAIAEVSVPSNVGACYLKLVDAALQAWLRSSRQFSRPWRRLLFWAAPWLPAARVNQAFHDRLYGAWGQICDSIEAARPGLAQDDPSFLACIAQQRELSTGAFPPPRAPNGSTHRACMSSVLGSTRPVS